MQLLEKMEAGRLWIQCWTSQTRKVKTKKTNILSNYVISSKVCLILESKTVQTSVAAHDTTGGMETKIAEAAMIAKLGIDVYIVKVKIIDTFFCLKVNHVS